MAAVASSVPALADPVYSRFRWWADAGMWETLTTSLRVELRIELGREPEPSAGSIDSQSVATGPGSGVVGCNAAKNVKGCKRHLVVDTRGTVLAALVTPANVQDPRTAAELLAQAKARSGPLTLIWGDGRYGGPIVRTAARALNLTIEVVAPPKGQKNFQALLRRWVIEESYKQAKNKLGCADFQVRSDTAIRRHWILVGCAFSFCWHPWGRQPPRAEDTPVEEQATPEPLRPDRADKGGGEKISTGRTGRTGRERTRWERDVAPGAPAGARLAGSVDFPRVLLARVVSGAPASRNPGTLTLRRFGPTAQLVSPRLTTYCKTSRR